MKTIKMICKELGIPENICGELNFTIEDLALDLTDNIGYIWIENGETIDIILSPTLDPNKADVVLQIPYDYDYEEISKALIDELIYQFALIGCKIIYN